MQYPADLYDPIRLQLPGIHAAVHALCGRRGYDQAGAEIYRRHLGRSVHAVRRGLAGRLPGLSDRAAAMSWPDYVLLGLIAVGAIAAVMRIHRHGSGCCGRGCCGNCEKCACKDCGKRPS